MTAKRTYLPVRNPKGIRARWIVIGVAVLLVSMVGALLRGSVTDATFFLVGATFLVVVEGSR